jgi:putative sterol carrier protein
MEPREFFDTLETRVDASQTAGVNKSYVFDIDGAGVWKVDVTDAGPKVTEGATDGDVTIRASEDTFRKIVNKEQSPTTAYMTGKLKIDGEMSAALKLQKLF